MSEEEKVTCESQTSEKETQTEETVEEKIEENQTEETTETHGNEAQEGEGKKEDDLQDKYLRLMAEYQNYRTRTAKEKTDIYAHANEKMALDVLEVIDNFERAMAQKPEGDKFAEGIELILKQLQSVLEKNGVTVMDTEGKEFDPNFHNAVMTEDAPEGTKPGTVTKVFQKGYLLNNKVIRAAMVAVAKE